MDKKDFRYIMLIAVLFDVAVVTWYYGGKGNDIVAYIGFAGTITSILLSVVAIFFSFIQSSESARQAANITKASDEIATTANDLTISSKNIVFSLTDLQRVTQELAQTSAGFISVVQGVKSSQEQLAASQNKLADNVDTSLRQYQTQVNQLLNEFQRTSARDQSPIDSTTPNGNQENLLLDSSDAGLIILLLFSKIKNPVKPKLLFEYLTDFNSRMNASSRVEISYAYGFIVGFTCTRLISYKRQGDDVEYALDPRLSQNMIREEIERRLKDGSEPLGVWYPVVNDLQLPS